MPTPTVMTWSASALAAANSALVDLLTNGSLKLRDASNTELASMPFSTPAGVVDPATGVATIAATGGTVTTNGTAAYAQLCSSDGTVQCSLPCVTGQSINAGRIVLNSLAMLVGSEIKPITIQLG